MLSHGGLELSDVSNVMISIGAVENLEVADEFFRWIEEEMPLKNGAEGPDRRRSYAYKPLLISAVDSPWGGWKAPEAHVYATTLNYAVVMSILEKCATFPWQDPDGLQLFIMDQEDPRFRVWQFDEGSLVELTP